MKTKTPHYLKRCLSVLLIFWFVHTQEQGGISNSDVKDNSPIKKHCTSLILPPRWIVATWCLSDSAAEQAFLENSTQRLLEEAVDRWQSGMPFLEFSLLCWNHTFLYWKRGLNSSQFEWLQYYLGYSTTGKNPIPSTSGEKSVWFLSMLKLFISIRELTRNCMCPFNMKTGIWQTVRYTL